MGDYTPGNGATPAASNDGVASGPRRSVRKRREPQNMVRESIPKGQMPEVDRWFNNVNNGPPTQNRKKTKKPGEETDFDMDQSFGDTPTSKPKQARWTSGADRNVKRNAKAKSPLKADLPKIPHAPPPAKLKGTGSAFKFHNKDGVPDREPNLGPEPSKVRQTLKICTSRAPQVPNEVEEVSRPTVEAPIEENAQEAEEQAQDIDVQKKPELRVPKDDKLIRIYFNDSPYFQRIPLTLLKQAPDLVLAFAKPSLRKRNSNHQNLLFRISDSAAEVSHTNTANNPIEISSDEEGDDEDDEDESNEVMDVRQPTKFFLAMHTDRQKRQRASNVNNLFARHLDFYLDVPIKSFNLWQTWIEERAASSDGCAAKYDFPHLSAEDRRAYMQELVECYLGFARKWKLVDFADYLMSELRWQSRLLRGTQCSPFQMELLGHVWKGTGPGDVLRSFVMYAVHEAFHPIELPEPGKMFGAAWSAYAEIRLEYRLGRELWHEDVRLRFEDVGREWDDGEFEKRTKEYWHLPEEEKGKSQGNENEGEAIPVEARIEARGQAAMDVNMELGS